MQCYGKRVILWLRQVRHITIENVDLVVQSITTCKLEVYVVPAEASAGNICSIEIWV